LKSLRGDSGTASEEGINEWFGNFSFKLTAYLDPNEIGEFWGKFNSGTFKLQAASDLFTEA
jgi:hypothetical protein